MGKLIAKAYPTKLVFGLADHTYVECSTGGVGWKCFGGKTGGRTIGVGAGSTKRADAIAGANEQSGLKCYAINGVCHQAANRILIAARITVERATGYGVSRAMFGTYGRVGVWPCKSPFDANDKVSGDLAACVGGAADTEADHWADASPDDVPEAANVEAILGLYRTNTQLFDPDTRPSLAEIEAFHQELFANLIDFKLGELPADQRGRLLEVRRSIEQRQLDIETRHAAEALHNADLAREVDELAVDLQRQMAMEMTDEQYERLFGLRKDDIVSVVDPEILAY